MENNSHNNENAANYRISKFLSQKTKKEVEGMARMWFPLKEKHSAARGGALWEMDAKSIKKGAPIIVQFSLNRLDKGARLITPDFFLFGVELTNINLKEDLILPVECAKDDVGSIFCAHTNDFFTFFHQSGLNFWLKEQIKYCPLCGRQLTEWPELPGSKFADWVVAWVER